MSRDLPQSQTPLTDPGQLVAFFAEGCKPPEARRVGTEHEKFIYDRETLARIPFEGERGMRRVFELLAERHGYRLGFDHGNVVAAEREGADGLVEAITTEPGGQFELSGAPVRFMRQTQEELDRHLSEVGAICEELGLIMVALGVDPLHTLEDVPWMPKSRYGIMRDYMPKVGRLGHWMMKMTCTVQANFDYTSEEDAADILRTALWVSPVVSAMFARSPLWRRGPSGFMSARNHIWTDTDPQRCGFPLFMVEGDFGFREYIEYSLDVPMYLIRRGGEYVDMSGRSFRRFMAEGFAGHEAVLGDYELHLSTIFPEVRMKRYIEVRGADVGPRDHILALPALWKGFLYDPQARREARALVEGFTLEERAGLFDSAARWSLEGPVPGRAGVKHRDLAASLIEIAAGGLRRQSAPEVGLSEPGEEAYLAPLRADLALPEGSAAHAVLARWEALGGDIEALVRGEAMAY